MVAVPGRARHYPRMASPTNRQIAELLARRAEETEGPRHRAYRRSSAAAFLWPEEAAAVHAAGRSLTELRYVGDRLAKRIAGWIEDPPEVPEPPPERHGFLTISELLPVIQSGPDWRAELRGDLQMHTVYSDGLDTVADMAEACFQLGYEYITITDHSTGQRIPRGMQPDAIARQAGEIDRANREFADTERNFRILRSIEMNLRPDGTGALTAEELRDFELVVGSFHSDLRTTEDQTKRYVVALSNPDVDIIGHPRGRMYSRRAGLHADWDAVFQAALRFDKAMEINANPARQDLQLHLLETAAEAGIRISLATDAHSIPELQFMDFSVGTALKAGIARDRVINFMTVDELLAWRAVRRSA